ncbi:MAG: transcriptional regulator [Gammaproteobacteria bacterium HGW-Gammaproteobacteria-15]|nr:MAG: transcriptional regulator [Gammaproteobacteria bacterium HGW-Gammaproteobacteria-15]
MKRKNLSKAECPVARSLDVIGDWWSLLIIRDAFDGINRFSALQKNLGIARSMLTARLQELVEHGVLETAPASDGTAYQEYVLTEMGRGLFPVIVALRQWGEANLYQPGEQHSVLLETQTGKPVTRLELRSRENQVLKWRDTMVRKLSPDGKH